MEHPGTMGQVENPRRKEMAHTHTHTRDFELRKQVRENEKVPHQLPWILLHRIMYVVPIFTPFVGPWNSSTQFFPTKIIAQI
jgi:hypothetical protein